MGSASYCCVADCHSGDAGGFRPGCSDAISPLPVLAYFRCPLRTLKVRLPANRRLVRFGPVFDRAVSFLRRTLCSRVAT